MLTNKNAVTRRGILSAAGAALVLVSGCSPSGPQALHEGIELLARGHAAEAVREFQMATDLMRTNATAWNYLGIALHSSGNFSNALNAYQHALGLNPALAEARFNLGCLYLESRQPEQATNELTAFTVRRSQDVQGWVKLGTAQLRARNLAAAERSFVKALQLSSNHAEALNGMGVVQVQRNRARDAASFFQRALAEQANYAPALLNLAIVEQTYLNNPAQALVHYRTYLSLQPRQPAFAQVQGLVAAMTAPPAPRPTATNALSSIPLATNVAPRIGATNAPNVARGQPARPPTPPAATSSPPETVRQPQRATQPPPGDPSKEARPSTNVAHVSASNPPPAQTETQIVTLAAEPRFPTNPAALQFKRYQYTRATPQSGNRSEALPKFNEGLTAQRAGDFTAAMVAYRAAIQQDPAFYEAHYNLGLAAYEAGQIFLSLAEYETALVLKPDSRDARYNFALALRAADYPLDAAEELKKLLAANPNEARLHFSLGNLYATQLGQPALARQHYERVLTLEPNHPQAASLRAWLAANPE